MGGFEPRHRGEAGISPATARNHVHNVLTKLGVQSRAEAVSLALRNGLI